MSWKNSKGKVVCIENAQTPPEGRCSGCRICEAICVLVHDGVANPKRSRIRILREVTQDHDLLFTPVVCQQCELRSCLEACPVDGFLEDEALGTINVNREECIGCEACVDECPHGAIFIDPLEQVALKCDLCGGEPKCVEYCPAGVLALSTD